MKNHSKMTCRNMHTQLSNVITRVLIKVISMDGHNNNVFMQMELLNRKWSSANVNTKLRSKCQGFT